MKRFVLLLLLAIFLGACFKKSTSEKSNRIPENQPVSLSSPTKAESPEPTPSLTIYPKITPTPKSKPTAIPQITSSSEPKCDPNYSGCVPIASDVDCAGGDGDGPKYVEGPIEIIGYDKYKLDRDGDGVACEQ